ncbi:hypothetical protein [Dyadobacter pollutisoli]|jgi:hypothetical protein|uniref:Uncharacterized protein n=1 Tax=Dyadobacter pollutisoli TaxID=2910158 RepID=A0A9E8NEW9_9BACT|nr:hypothetical protein [Dyadobacter pollutisoli]WAC14693.1 hypothetical protein ON006_12170 [Dyadobacter pollutisoli]
MKVICKFNAPSNVPDNIPNDFDFGLCTGKEYTVMGMLTFKGSNNLHFLVDENGRLSWFPFQIFTISNNEVPENWFININVDDIHVDYLNLLCFDELCNKKDFFNQLLERDEEAIF